MSGEINDHWIESEGSSRGFRTFEIPGRPVSCYIAKEAGGGDGVEMEVWDRVQDKWDDTLDCPAFESGPRKCFSIDKFRRTIADLNLPSVPNVGRIVGSVKRTKFENQYKARAA